MHVHHEKMHTHFTSVAPLYRNIRITDLEPIQFISEKLKGLGNINAVDVGCGTGRYDLLLFRNLNSLHLTCIDINKSMLRQASDYLNAHGIQNYKAIKANFVEHQLKKNTFDCVFTFNAIHHFNFLQFIEEAATIIKRDGLIFIYTRLREQNKRSIWGKYFPLFQQKEDRLYKIDQIKKAVYSTCGLSIESVRSFRFNREATLNQLLERVNKKHYSTFSLYSDRELEDSLEKFKKNISSNFSDYSRIKWLDENILIILRHEREN